MTGSGIGQGARSFTFSPPNPANQYKRLFSVAVTHNFYTQNDGLCPDFQVVPTDATATVMASLGMAFKNEGAGFSVFYQAGMLNGILGYLRREAAADPEGHPGFWSRLTFLLQLTNPEFLGITALPLCLTQARANLYGCNRDAHREEGGVAGDEGVALLSKGEFMGADALYGLVGSEVDLTVPHETARVTVSDISGAVVYFVPNKPDEKLVESGTDPNSTKHAVLDLTGLPHDLYTFTLEDAEFKPIGDPWTKLYVPSDGGSMVLLDMLFTKPTEDSAGVYPIPPLFGGDPPPDECGGTLYQLPFDARQTYWQYYVVSQIPGSQLLDLKIEGRGAQFGEKDKPVHLPDGSWARLFTADTALPLRQKSAQRFKLSGRRRDPNGQDNAILLVRLPVAPAAPVWPIDKSLEESLTGKSEMYVYV